MYTVIGLQDLGMTAHGRQGEIDIRRVRAATDIKVSVHVGR